MKCAYGLEFGEPLEGLLCGRYWTTRVFWVTRTVYDGKEKQKSFIIRICLLVYCSLLAYLLTGDMYKNTGCKNLLNLFLPNITWEILNKARDAVL